MEILSWIGLSLGLFTGLLMVTKKRNSVSDKLLAGWLFLLGIEFMSSAMDYSQFGYPLMSNAFLLMNPAFFLYISALIVRSFKLRWVHLLHLLPYLLFEISAYIIKEPLEFHNFLKPTGTFLFRYPFGAASILSWGVYTLLSLLTVIRHRKIFESEFSNPALGKSLKWILLVLVLYSSICLVSFILGLVTIFGETAPYLPHYFALISLLVLVFLLAFYGIRKERIFEVFGPDYPGTFSQPSSGASYKRTHLSSERKEEIKHRLIEAFETERLFLNPNLNMDVLSDLLNIPKHHITEVLNTLIGRNFFQFVNQYRVEEVKNMLKDPRNQWSIEAIGYACGFSSKSSFFSTFKKLTGITPAQFRSK